MATHESPAVDPLDPAHELVDHLLTHRQPDDAPSQVMADLRAAFIDLGHAIVDDVPRCPDRTVALRSLHRACMDAIAALALNPR